MDVILMLDHLVLLVDYLEPLLLAVRANNADLQLFFRLFWLHWI